MKLSLSWLRDYVKIPKDLTSDQLINDLTVKVAELEDVIDRKKSLAGVVVGKVLQVEKHPNADKLRVAMVDLGSAYAEASGLHQGFGQQAADKAAGVQIVCGAPNLAVGQIVPVATVGAVVHGGALTIEKAKIRGVESNGMICAEDEIGLGTSHEGIMVLNDLVGAKIKMGTPLAEALGLDEIILDIDNKAITHRPDLWCHFGFAREFAAIYGLKPPKEYETALCKNPAKKSAEIKIESNGCKRYVGALVRGVKIEPSPKWMQKRLETCGIRPISNIVDITNYVMIEVGQPMHAFDFDKVEGAKIVVRNAQDGEEMTTLDGVQRKLKKNYVVIADAKKALAVGGVMGGANSEIGETTTNIFLEAATFEKLPIREARIGLGLQSEATNRFEKGLNHILPALAMNRAWELLKEMCPEATLEFVGEALKSGVLAAEEENKREIKVPLAYFNRISGVDFKKTAVKKILESLGFVVTIEGKDAVVRVPYFRQTDIKNKEDVAEELIRIYGLQTLEPAAPISSVDAPRFNSIKKFEWQLRSAMVGAGLYEVLLYDFVSRDLMDKCRLSLENCVEVLNALTKEATHMAPSLLPNLLLCVEKNHKHRDDFGLFRIGRVFNKDIEKMALAAAFTRAKNEEPYYLAKAAADYLFQELHLNVTYKKINSDDIYNPGRVAEIMINDVAIGRIGEIHPAVQKTIDIKSRVAALEIDIYSLFQEVQKAGLNLYKPICQYPAVERDFSMFVDKKCEASTLIEAVLAVNKKIVSCNIFDVYAGQGVPEGKKSVALRFVLQDEAKTLQDAEVQEAMKAVEASLVKLGANIRK